MNAEIETNPCALFKARGRAELQHSPFLITVTDGQVWSASSYSRFTLYERITDIVWIWELLGPTAGADDMGGE